MDAILNGMVNEFLSLLQRDVSFQELERKRQQIKNYLNNMTFEQLNSLFEDIGLPTDLNDKDDYIERFFTLIKFLPQSENLPPEDKNLIYPPLGYEA